MTVFTIHASHMYCLTKNLYNRWVFYFSVSAVSVQFSRSVVSDSLRPHESQHARPPCPLPTPRVHSDSCPSSRLDVIKYFFWIYWDNHVMYVFRFVNVVHYIDLWMSVQFSRSVMYDSLQPLESQHPRLSCPLPTPRVHSNSCPLSQWCHPAISSVLPFASCSQSFPV